MTRGSIVIIRIATQKDPDVIKDWTLQEFYWAVENGEAEITQFIVHESRAEEVPS